MASEARGVLTGGAVNPRVLAILRKMRTAAAQLAECVDGLEAELQAAPACKSRPISPRTMKAAAVRRAHGDARRARAQELYASLSADGASVDEIAAVLADRLACSLRHARRLLE